MKSLVIASGGLDSAVMVQYVKDQENESPVIIGFNYGQRNSKELSCLRKLYPEAIILNVSDIFSHIKSCLTPAEGGGSVPLDQPLDDVIDFINVPFRNGIFLSIAVGIAKSMGINRVQYGALVSKYPDNSEAFREVFANACRIGVNDDRFTIIAPLGILEKEKVIDMGHRLKVPLKQTWSCYLNGEKHCGRCNACQARKEGFKKSGLDDPTEYD